MGNKKKVGKQRKDKFYQLAKETGYRSRAAFKLIQLNRKFEFLQRSQVCLDLCAAPGGWMQVAKQNMPVSSIVIGVDLFPIKSIAGCVSIVGDITTDQCYHAISKELQNWKVDVVLHDGAPNVGQNWLYDAYQQVCLTLSSFKLATRFLKPGGWFVTKVFRSKDYNALLWVLKQFFKKVHATKPQASRNESAEIFIVCSQYLAPAKIDPKFLDPRHVFKELDMEPTLDKTLLKPHKAKKSKAEGYSETEPVHRVYSAKEFVQSDNPLLILQAASAIEFEDDEISKQKETTEEIRQCCLDIKVLGRKDLKSLLSWGKIMKQRLYPDQESKESIVKLDGDVDQKTAVEESQDELEELDKKISVLENEERRELKRKKKKSQKERSKLRERLDLKMVHKDDDGPLDEDPMMSMFSIDQITSHKILDGVTDQSPDVVAESEEESEQEEPAYRSTRVKYSKDQLPEYYEDNVGRDDDSDSDTSSQHTDRLGLSDDEEEEPVKKEKKVRWCDEDEEEEKQDNPLVTDLDYRDPLTKRQQRAQLWFNKDAFKNLEKDDDEEFEINELASAVSKQQAAADEAAAADKADGSDAPVKPGAGDGSDGDSGISESEGSDSEDSDSDYSVENEMASNVKVSNKTGDFEIAPKGEKRKKKRKLDEEGLALGALMIQSKKKRQEIIDGGWNRFSFNDSNLPDWFVEYQQTCMRKEAPVPKELVAEYKRKKDELNVRPIKKVIEAKARKKKRTLRKLEQAKKKIEGLMDNPDVSEREKQRQIQRMYKRAKDKKPEVTYVVAKKNQAGKRMARPRGVKGRYKVVDHRMKKDMRKDKILMKTRKGRRQLDKKKNSNKKKK